MQEELENVADMKNITLFRAKVFQLTLRSAKVAKLSQFMRFSHVKLKYEYNK